MLFVMNKRAGFFSEIKKDLIANGWENRKIRTALRILFFELGVQVLLCYRIQVRIIKVPIVGILFARILSYFSQVLTGCHISFTAFLEGGISIPHANGIVVGRNAIVRSNTSIYQQVTLGSDAKGMYPVLDSGVTVYAGAKIIGGLHLGDGATVGANSVVISDVDKGVVVAGVPARVIRAHKESVSLL